MYEIRKHKSDIRKQYLERRTALSAEARAARDEKIRKNILASAAYRYADVLLLYYPIKAEVNVLPIMEAALASGKKVAFPRCHAEDHSMTFHYISCAADFEEGSFGIKEPLATLPIFESADVKDKNALCIVPAVVYDRRGYRVGYGGGYYDRFFGKFRPASIGVVYEEFILRNVPHGRFDISVDVVVSERGIYACK
ncbi:MAG: 5-formyltetrahydrofolate cyclo-ligase [Clostridia bacterium]|nr:5-formyltetrahydrofolate cyclo-ligase [Clostridia bacterium]